LFEPTTKTEEIDQKSDENSMLQQRPISTNFLQQLPSTNKLSRAIKLKQHLMKILCK
jgi:hypothetical protein